MIYIADSRRETDTDRFHIKVMKRGAGHSKYALDGSSGLWYPVREADSLPFLCTLPADRNMILPRLIQILQSEHRRLNGINNGMDDSEILREIWYNSQYINEDEEINDSQTNTDYDI